MVVTIVVLLILAGVTLSALTGENGIIGRAIQARDFHRIGNIDDKVKVAVNSAFADGWAEGGLHKIIHTNLDSELENQFGIDGYILTPYENENKVLVLEEGKEPDDEKIKYWIIDVEGQKYYVPNSGQVQKVIWTYDKDKDEITDGEVTMKIGDYIDYNPIPRNEDNVDSNKLVYVSYRGTETDGGIIDADKTKNLEKGNGYEDTTYEVKTDGSSDENEDVKWRICGINDKTGEIKIIADKCIKSNEGLDFGISGLNGVVNGVTELNEICKIYGYGYGASTARSVNIEDINTLTGYNPQSVGADKTPYSYNEISQYGCEVKYYWGANAGDFPFYEYTRDLGKVNIQHTKWNGGNKFSYLDENLNGYCRTRADDEKTKDINIVTLKSNYYRYYVQTLSLSITGADIKFPKGTAKYNTFFGKDSGDLKYWLANNYTFLSPERPEFGIMKVDYGWINNTDNLLYSADGYNSTYDYQSPTYIRPIVTLKYDVSLKLNQANKTSKDTSGNTCNNWIIE